MADRHVVIVGAGAAGSSLALLLARRGIATTILERRTEPLQHPAAHVVNAPTLETWEEVDQDLARSVAALSPPLEEITTIRWASELSDPIADLDIRGDDPQDLVRLRTLSPYLRSHVGQHQLMQELWAALDREPLVDLRRGTVVEDVRTGRDGAVELLVAGQPAPASRFVIAADGANSVLRERSGISLEGPVLAHMGSAFLHAPGLYGPEETRPLLSWIYRPDFAGVLIAHADDCYVLMTIYLHPAQEVARSPRSYWERTVPSVLGRDDVTIRSTGTWSMTSQLATRFRAGRLLLVGDAAHRFPHTGGFGLNSGVQDAENLAWKLEAVLDGAADEALLDTYEEERRPVIERFADYSVTNHFRLDEVTKPFGVSNAALRAGTTAVAHPPFSWLPGRLAAGVVERLTRLQLARTAGLDPSSRRSDRLRAHVRRTVPDQIDHFVATGLEFGYGYRGRLVATEPGEVPIVGDGVREYRPTTWPGHRLPHLPVLVDDEVVPIRRLVGPRGLTLLTLAPGPWRAWVDEHLTDLPFPFDVRAVVPAEDLDPEVVERLEVGPDGAVVVRPDAHVVWRTVRTPDRSGHDLASFLESSWSPTWRTRSSTSSTREMS
ncbi:MAG: FAD-dependent monooxygenase [Aeromicrobium erythreum]